MYAAVCKNGIPCIIFVTGLCNPCVTGRRRAEATDQTTQMTAIMETIKPPRTSPKAPETRQKLSQTGGRPHCRAFVPPAHRLLSILPGWRFADAFGVKTVYIRPCGGVCLPKAGCMRPGGFQNVLMPLAALVSLTDKEKENNCVMFRIDFFASRPVDYLSFLQESILPKAWNNILFSGIFLDDCSVLMDKSKRR